MPFLLGCLVKEIFIYIYTFKKSITKKLKKVYKCFVILLQKYINVLLYFYKSIMDRVEQLSKVQKEALELFQKKNADYGDSFATYGPVGVIVRMGDKISRLTSVTNNGVNLVNDESIRDTLIDLHNYSAMAVMLMDE